MPFFPVTQQEYKILTSRFLCFFFHFSLSTCDSKEKISFTSYRYKYDVYNAVVAKQVKSVVFINPNWFSRSFGNPQSLLPRPSILKPDLHSVVGDAKVR